MTNIIDRKLVSLWKSNDSKKDDPIEKWAKDVNRYFTLGGNSR